MSDRNDLNVARGLSQPSGLVKKNRPKEILRTVSWFIIVVVILFIIVIFFLIYRDNKEKKMRENFVMKKKELCSSDLCRKDSTKYVLGMGKPVPNKCCENECGTYVDASGKNLECYSAMPGCKVKLDGVGVNQAYSKFIRDGGKAGHAGSSDLGLLLDQPETCRVVGATRKIGVNDCDWVSPNQKLVGPPNPKFLMPPVVVPPSLDNEYWKTNNLVIRSGINSHTPFDEVCSGYEVQVDCSGCPNSIPTGSYAPTIDVGPPGKLENNPNCADSCYAPSPGPSPAPSPSPATGPTPNAPDTEDCKYILQYPKCSNPMPTEKMKKSYELPVVSEGDTQFKNKDKTAADVLEPFVMGSAVDTEPPTVLATDTSLPNSRLKKEGNKMDATLINDHGILVSTTYNQDQTTTLLPSNFSASKCRQEPNFAELNVNTFTSHVSPGIFQSTQVIEPINSNMGISFTQQIPPTTITQTEKGLLYEQHDPNMYEPPPETPQDQTANNSTVTDPRFTGYGASDRHYTCPVTGMTKFFYKDVDAIRMPGYFSRSKIDANNWAQGYGPVPVGMEHGDPQTANIRVMANNAFRDATLTFRTEMMQSLMRKRNAEMYQQKLMPIQTNGHGSHMR
jgi:hypothetical protein